MGKTKEVDEWVAAGEDDHKTKGGVSSGKQAPVTVAKDAGDGLRGMPGLGGNAEASAATGNYYDRLDNLVEDAVEIRESDGGKERALLNLSILR